MAKSKDDIVTIGKVKFSRKHLKGLRELMTALMSAQKIKILLKVRAAGKQGICVSDISADKSIGLVQSHTSILLSGLKKAGLVSSMQKGKYVYYTVNDAALAVAKEVIVLAEKKKLI